MTPARRLTPVILVLAALALIAASAPFLFHDGPGPSTHVSVRGDTVRIYGFGPYRHMPEDLVVQGFAQDLFTLVIGVPFLLVALFRARRGSKAGHLALTGAVAYLFVQYTLYLAMATYNELFLLWVALAGLSAQALFRLLLAIPASEFVVENRSRKFVGRFLLVNATLITLLWLSVIVPPLVKGSLYPAGLGHLTTMIVQGFDLAFFLPPSVLAGLWYLRAEPRGELLAPVYAVFLALQMQALLAKIAWMMAVGAPAGPAIVIIPLLLLGAVVAAVKALRPHRG